MSGKLLVEYQMAQSFDGKRATPIAVVVSENLGNGESRLIYSSAIFASAAEFDIPTNVAKAVSVAPSEYTAKMLAMQACAGR